jgi:hypothetical protein
MRSTAHGAIALITMAALVGCADGTTVPRLSPAAPSLTKTGAYAGTTLSATKTATGFYEERLDYEWTLTKRVEDIMDEGPSGMFSTGSTSEVRIPRREVRWIEYVIDAERREGSTKQVAGVRGQICVKNTGGAATQGLKIVDVVQVKKGGGHFTNYKSVSVNVSAKPVLAANESYCYPYEMLLDRVSGAQYRNTARVTIDNYDGHEAEYGPCDDDEGDDDRADKSSGVKVSFSIPATPSAGPPMDADAVIHDGMKVDNRADRSGPCAEHFYLYFCTTNTSRDEWYLTQAKNHITYVIDMHNFFGCDDAFDFPNTAELIEGGASGSGVRRTAYTNLRITSDACAPPPGCVRTDDYWKQSSHKWPDEPVEPSWIRNEYEFFDSGKTWQQTVASRSDELYAALAREYVAASLNRANGAAMPANVREAYAASAHYFSLLPGERALTSRGSLAGWFTVLQSYNEGKKGIPSCGKEPKDGKDHDGKHDKDHTDDNDHRS